MIKIVNKFSDDIEMSFGIDKCKKLTIQRGKIVDMENIQLNNGGELKSLELNQQYKYLEFGAWPPTKQPNQPLKIKILND